MSICRIIAGVAAFGLAAATWAVPGPLDRYHAPLSGILRYSLRVEYGINGIREYTRTELKYTELKSNHRWETYIGGFPYVEPSKLKTAPPEDLKAFWINTYNAFAIQAVLESYPLPNDSFGRFPSGSIQSIRNVWDAKHPLAGSMISLNQIEDKLRDMHDPRVFLALCRCSRGSPQLSPHAYNQTYLEDQLEAAANNFCNAPQNFHLDQRNNRLYLSGIFQEYGAVFQANAGSIPRELLAYGTVQRAVVNFLLQRITTADRRYILSRRPRVIFEDIDWRLNEAK